MTKFQWTCQMVMFLFTVTIYVTTIVWYCFVIMIKRAKNQQTIYIKITFPGSQLKKALLFLHANGLTSPSHVLKMNILTTTIHHLHPTTCFNKPHDKKCMSVRVQILPNGHIDSAKYNFRI